MIFRAQLAILIEQKFMIWWQGGDVTQGLNIVFMLAFFLCVCAHHRDNTHLAAMFVSYDLS